MKLQVGAVTALSLLFAALFASLMGMVLAQMSLPLTLGVGLCLAVLMAAMASNELALYLLIFSMLLGPQVLVGELGQGATLGRGLTLRVDDFLLLIVGLAWLAKSALHKELGLVFRTPLNRPIAAYAFAAVFATGLGMIAGWVTLLGGSFFVLKYVQYFVIYFMVVNNLTERRQFERFLIALLLTAGVASFIGILQIPSGQRVSAVFEGAEGGEPNTFGGYLVLMFAVVAGLYLTSESLRRKFLLACLAVLIFVPLIFTLSRSSYIALVPLAGALFAWSDRKRFLALLFVACLAATPLLVPKAVADRVLYTIAQPPEKGQLQVGGVRLDTSTTARLVSWKQVFKDWPRHPVFGWGVTGYGFVDSQYPRVLVESGLVGLLAFVWLQVSLFREARKILKTARDPLFRGVALGFLAGIIALITHSVGANTFIIVRIMEPFWFLAGMVMMIPQLEAVPAASGVVRGPRPWGASLPGKP